MAKSGFVRTLLRKWKYRGYPNLHTTAYLGSNIDIVKKENLIMHERTNINGNAIIMNSWAKVIIKMWA